MKGPCPADQPEERGRDDIEGPDSNSALPAGVPVRMNGKEPHLPAGMIVLAVGARPDRELAIGLAGRGLRHFVVGDAAEPRGIGEAIWEAHQAALDV